MIRSYKNSDFDEIVSWWVLQNECPPSIGMMIENGTFVLEIDSVPALSLTVFLTQSKEIAYIEGFIKNPSFFGCNLEEHGNALWNHCYQYAKANGYKRVICYCLVDKLKTKYQRFGMTKMVDNLSGFVKEI